ncbi:hypothetical protein V6N12_007408 [Hibiscus sabdariffa]|uniref:FHA domain-containing protein n=1 Tax=Hibiscus sabdariffa TaxID=183260 RepID=A0ABR2F1N0_9ROSI
MTFCIQILLHHQGCRRSNIFRSCFIIKGAEDQTSSDLASSSRMQKIKLFFSSCFIIRDAEDQTSSNLASSSRMQKIKLLQILLHRQGCRRSNLLGLASPSGVQKIKPFRSCFIVRGAEDQMVSISHFIVRDAEDQIVSRSHFIVRDAEDQTF